jgi:Mrp family chromosome partitioning ATPase
LIGYFESRDLTHKPKLVAVTSLGKGAGVTTIAAGLANSLSETGDGNVLVVDLTPGQGSAQQFYKGKPVVGLEDIGTLRDSAQIQDNLFVVGEGLGSDKLSRILPQRFNKMLPKLKASDFDYIIFDMPPVSQISITPRLAGFMDMVLLVVESEKTDQEIVRRATALLADSNAHVGAVLNKTITYVPQRLHQDSLGNA